MTPRRLKLVVLFSLLCLASGYLVAACSAPDEEPQTNVNSVTETPDQLPANLANALAKPDSEGQDKEYEKFTHSSDYHNKLPCLACHQRESNASRIRMPGKLEHSPCIGCHTLQFEDKGSSICNICHTDTEEGTVRAFPALQSFGVRFNHSKHLKTGCATCHKSVRGGVAFSIPAGRNAHTTCFQCHSSKASNEMASCGLCHQPGRSRIRRSLNSKAFKVKFSHAKHGRRQKLNCNSCHTVRRGSRLGKQVSAPAAQMHFSRKGVKSCASCHNNRRAFGGDDFSDCKRCHQGSSFSF